MSRVLHDYSNIDFINDNERQYFMEANLGEQVRSFLNSPTGRYLHGRAKLELEDAKTKLLELDPYSSEGRAEHAKIKTNAWAAQNFITWCSEAIINGDAAATQLDEIGNEER